MNSSILAYAMVFVDECVLVSHGGGGMAELARAKPSNAGYAAS